MKYIFTFIYAFYICTYVCFLSIYTEVLFYSDIFVVGGL